MLDTYTLLVLLTLTHFLSTASLAVVWWINRGVPGVREWLSGRFVAVAGLVFVTLRTHLDPPTVIVIGNLLVAIGYFIALSGHRKFMARAPYPKWGGAVALAIYVPVFGYFSFVDFDLSARTIVASTLFTVYSILSAHTFWPGGERRGGRLSCKVVSGLFALHAVFSLTCIGLTLSKMTGTRLLDSSITAQAMLLEGVVLSIFTMLGYVTMVTERLQTEMKQQALVDPLTGIYNRRAFYPLARQAFAQRTRTGSPISVILLDIDRFKSVNDAFGHAVGDRALVHVAGVLRRALRGADILCRFGGEEFLVLLPAATLPEALLVAERIRSQVEKAPLEIGGETLTVTVSLGVRSPRRREGDIDVDVLISQADRALYRAKMSGRNRALAYGPEDGSSLDARRRQPREDDSPDAGLIRQIV